MRRTSVALATTLIVVVAGTSAASAPVPPCDGRLVLDRPAAGTAYHTAYFSPTNDEETVTDASIEGFEAMTGREVAGVVFSDPWGHGGKLSIDFPRTKVRTAWRHGAVPMVRMMPWTRLSRPPDPVVTMGKVAAGRYDGPLRRWFRDARDLGIPLWVEFGVEVNGRWFPWNGVWNGGGRTDGYGDPSKPDGPERFRHAYRHVVRLARDVGADDLTWVFHVDVERWPDATWNDAHRYFPGDAFVDWVAVSVYGEQVPSGKPSHWSTLPGRLGHPDDPHSRYVNVRSIAPEKPLALVEFGVTEDPEAGDKAEWYAEVYGAVTPPGGTYGFDLVSVWSERWNNGGGVISDLRVNSSAIALEAYRAGIADPALVSSPSFACV
jgi:hypothetical protein